MTLTQPLHRAVQQHPDRPMTINGDRVRTARETADRVARLGGALTDLGVQPGDRVGLLALNSDRYHEAFFGIWWVGAVAAPLNIRWSAIEIAYAADDAGVVALLVDDALAPHVAHLREHCPGIRTFVHIGDGPVPDGTVSYEELLAAADPVVDRNADPGSLAMILYTGGTTGNPKGAMHTHRGIATGLMGTQLAGGLPLAGEVTLHTSPLFHIAAIASWHNQNIIGGTQVFMPMFSAEAFLTAVEKHRVNVTILVPTMMEMILGDPGFADYDLSSLRVITYGAAASSDELTERAIAAFPQAELTQGYGMTETGVLTMLSGADLASDGPRRRATGRAAVHAEIEVHDEDGNAVPNGTVGEVVTRGDHVMIGYWGLPEQTAETLRGGWMHTGDLGRLDDDGYLYIVDRLKDMIITGGENVYSAEVENALAHHPEIAASAVVGIPDQVWGERVHAAIVLEAGSTVTVDDVRAFVRTRIAGYKVPRSIEFLAELPMTAIGKIRKKDVRDALIARERESR